MQYENDRHKNVNEQQKEVLQEEKYFKGLQLIRFLFKTGCFPLCEIATSTRKLLHRFLAFQLLFSLLKGLSENILMTTLHKRRGLVLLSKGQNDHLA